MAKHHALLLHDRLRGNRDGVELLIDTTKTMLELIDNVRAQAPFSFPCIIVPSHHPSFLIHLPDMAPPTHSVSRRTRRSSAASLDA